ncbi:hypothetical protein HJB56_22100 [Rhizobium lentis]|uniref:hypothetical protein n=1 Tax=Rhizobium lentis TaxID=1138194 RepID=UPI001C833298|nr:hypothetical protein [Rhizobium lentis]MBX4957335.1 hypothetical protein [Rhizobium lentis]MBX4975089.1 hypothetical protein [Rhizobium lentis]MBX4987325.1 hypothetical protein [Rhizobium lentis]MBX4997296.1 hypothetical protein [Rhizobium lentis]MBX5005769.1 hypothetical protein [Rhizobium lentis]
MLMNSNGRGRHLIIARGRPLVVQAPDDAQPLYDPVEHREGGSHFHRLPAKALGQYFFPTRISLTADGTVGVTEITGSVTQRQKG